MSEETFSLEAKHGTYIWRWPPKYDVFFNVPSKIVRTMNLSDFHRARVSVSAKEWRVRADHGGLLLAVRNAGAPADSSPARWFRVGPELLKDDVIITVTGCDKWADQSMHPLDPEDESEGEVTVEVRRESTTTTAQLWVYQLVMSSTGQVLKRHAIRQCSWFFEDEDQGMQLEIGAYAARPSVGQNAQGEPLQLHFSKFLVD